MPERIQQRRTKGWRMPANAVSVARPSQWGNPYRVVRANCSLGGMCWQIIERDAFGNDRVWRDHLDTELRATEIAVEAFRTVFTHPVSLAIVRDALAGKDLACWCPLDHPCHADVLLEIANT